jgi:hypothetical protein
MNPTSYHDKVLKKLETEGSYLNITKAVYVRLTANIILNGERLKAFPIKLGMRHDCTFSPLLINTVLQFLTRSVRQEKEIRTTQLGKEEVQLSLFADNINL